ncbi:GGDEF domain-containing protein [Rhizorhabdus dicambivorans]|uniref:diguanylate cyclase n=1 Tax=Rhizorhabdus dicambivorans TaxID=1850238 RepID=A0A2A4FS81_9SPHN|nr:GGDEF domain-containing protein [Rhizorhabdus dicambivorans]PCE41273.1 GGDEF domain-containing protein [Rhizorhabdus dicambivorans]
MLLGWLLLAAGASDAAGPRWSDLAATVFHNYGRDQGLPHPVPTALAQDRDGFIWIGTQGGLARWDGYRFHSYKADPTKPGSLHDDWIQLLHVDRAGRLWVGGGAAGLARYHAARDRFVPVPIGPTEGRIHIGAIADDGRGGLWIGSDDGLRHLDPARGTVRPTTFPPAPVRALLREARGALWVGTTRGLWRRAAGATAFAPVPLPKGATGVGALFQDGDGRIWVGTLRRGLLVIDPTGTAPRPIGGEAILSTGSVSTISAAGPHEIWAGLRGNGIASVDTATGRVRLIRHDRSVANSLAHNDVWALLRDRAGSLWVGSTGGLSYHPRTAGLISTILASPGQAGGLSASDPLSLLATRDGRLWLGYLDGGVDLVDPAGGRIAALRPGTSLPPDVVFAMAEAEDGSVHIGTRRGLYHADRLGRAARLVTIAGRDPHAAVTALAHDAGILWVGGDDSGLLGVAPATGRVIFRPRLADGGIAVIRRGKGNDLWIGSRNGLYRLDLATRAVEHIAPDPADAAALPGRFVVALLVDRQGRLWAGTFGGGLGVMTGRGADGRPRFRKIGVAQGLPHANVDSLQMDGAGTIWAGTDDGLARIDPATLAVRALRQADGSALIDYFAGAGATSATGEALFGAKGGVTIVRPGRLPHWTLQPPLVITDLRVGGVSVPVASFNRGTSIGPLTLTPEGNSLAVEFAALDFTAPERNRYAYRLDGFDRDWTETDANRRLAIYTNLPPGDYVLRLRGSNRAGVWAERELSLPVRVMPAWYQRLWFRLAMAVAALLAIVAIVRWRTRYLRDRQADLERQITERTAALRAANDRLGQLAMTDPLTGCANRRHFMARAEELIAAAQRDGQPLSLAILDLDEFKQVNDHHGHPGGDAVLARTGRTILDQAAPGEVAGRIGGEEFALLMPNTGLADARRRAEQLREAIGAGSVEIDGERIAVTTSMGVARLGRGDDFSRLYARADAALYTAKDGGRNRVELVPPAE